LEKLNYYYAVVECDSVETAGEIYKSCDGLEFERSSNVLDLSFIPDDVTFDLPPREVRFPIQDRAAHVCVPPHPLSLSYTQRTTTQTAREVPSNYEAPTYYTSALQHSKVELTWDADDSHRRRVMQKCVTSSASMGWCEGP
jgi:hypothetical protein